MLLTRAIKLKLDYPLEDFLPTAKAYTDAVNQVCQLGWSDNDKNMVSLQHKLYYSLRKTLPAQLCISALHKGCESLRSVFQLRKRGKLGSCPVSKRSSIRFDHRSYNIWFSRNQISLLLVGERKKFNIFIPKYFKQYLSWRRKSAELFIRKGKIFLNIVFDKDVEDTVSAGKTVGIDRGIKKIAVTSDKRFFGGGHVKQICRRRQRVRSVLQKAGTKSAKRHLKKLSLKENRFRRDVNHCISKQIVEPLSKGTTLVLEDLTNIRGNSKKFRKKERAAINNWSFFQLEQFLKYKAEAKGVLLAHVDARYTSQKCSRCGHISKSNRPHQAVFKCKKCEYSVNADLNAAFNISKNYQDATCHPDRGSVNNPIVAPSGSYKPTALAMGS